MGTSSSGRHSLLIASDQTRSGRVKGNMYFSSRRKDGAERCEGCEILHEQPNLTRSFDTYIDT